MKSLFFFVFALALSGMAIAVVGRGGGKSSPSKSSVKGVCPCCVEYDRRDKGVGWGDFLLAEAAVTASKCVPGISYIDLMALAKVETQFGSYMGIPATGSYSRMGRMSKRVFRFVASAHGHDWKRLCTSRTGAMGVMQFIPSTWATLAGLDERNGELLYRPSQDRISRALSRKNIEIDFPNPYDPLHSMVAAALYLSDLKSRFGGRMDLALAAYNQGPGAIRSRGSRYRVGIGFSRKVFARKDWARRCLNDLMSPPNYYKYAGCSVN